MSFMDLNLRARTVAATLQEMRAEGERVLLVLPPGLDYITAFLGCLFAGAVAVPVYPPDLKRLHKTLPRIQAIRHDAQAAIALTTSSILAQTDSFLNSAPDLKSIKWVASDGIAREIANCWSEPNVNGSTLALLQYTSGSTGKPKGVMLTHANLLYNSSLIQRCCENTSETHGVIWLPPYHDMGLIGGILQPIYAGYSATLMSPDAFLARPLRWLQAITRFRGTLSGGPNFAYDLCVKKATSHEIAELDLGSWTIAFNGAEPVRSETIDRFSATFAPCGFRREAFYPCYGLAEATLLATGSMKGRGPVTKYVNTRSLEKGFAVGASASDGPARPLVGSGRTIAGQRLKIVDPDKLIELRPGRVGEIWISSESVAQGYWSQPEESRRTFQAFLSDTEAGPFLRTGDLGFLDGDELFVTGRLKDLIIIRGVNLYPQDIEAIVEASHPRLRPGCGAAFSIDVGGQERLVIVQEIDAAQEGDPREAITAIRRAAVEAFDVQPFGVVLIRPRTILKTSSGKIQRKATRLAFLEKTLSVVDESILDASQASSRMIELSDSLLQWTAPQERVQLVESFLRCQVSSLASLPVEELDVQAPLSAFGVDSLMATEISVLINERLDVEISPVDLLRGSTIAQIANQIIRKRSTGEIQRHSIEQTGSAKANGEAGSRNPKAGREQALSFAQQRLWFLNQLMPNNPFYNVPLGIRLNGPLNVLALAESLIRIIKRHEVLRTIYAEVDGSPAQMVLKEPKLSFRVVDLTEIPESARDSQAQQAACLEVRTPFDLSRGPVLRAVLMKLDDDDHVLLVTVHHIVCDGWSMNIFLRELGQFYSAIQSNEPANLPELPMQYGDFARRQREWLQSGALEPQVAYWRARLANAIPLLALPIDRSRPAVQAFRGARHDLMFLEPMSQSVRSLAREQGATVFMILLAALKALLYRYTAQSDICVGVAIHNRNWVETRNLIGFFANTLVLRSDLSDDPTYLSLLRQVREIALDAYAHQDLPFEKLVETLRPQRDLSYTPVFQVMFLFQNTVALPPDSSSTAGLSLRHMPALEDTGSSKRDLAFQLMETAEGRIAGFIEYDSDLFYASTISRMADHFQNLLIDISRDPGKRISSLAMLSERERRMVVAESQTIGLRSADEMIHEVFEKQADTAAARMAVLCDGEGLTYAQLNYRANQLARYLRRLGVRAEDRVGLFVERSLEMAVAALGILKSEAAYVPLDPAYPENRLDFILDDSGVKLLVTQTEFARFQPACGCKAVYLDREWPLISQESGDNLERTACKDNLAYLIYTSGSTGNPKGVMVTHSNLTRYVQSLQRGFKLSSDDRYLHTASIAFSSSVRQLLVPLSHGCTVVVASAEVLRDPIRLFRQIKEHRVTVIDLIPSHWKSCIRMLAALQPGEREDLLNDSLRLVLSASEPLGPEIPAAWRGDFRRQTEFINMFGQTETAGIVAVYPISEQSDEGFRHIPIGRAIAHAGVYVLDDFLQPAPIRLPGDIYVAGDGVSRGYFNRPDLTAERFIPSPFHDEGARLYKTGDRGRLSPDGNIEFLGRTDHQVKIRGYRIELGEIEAMLRRHPNVEEAIVVVRHPVPGEQQLAAYVASREPSMTSNEILGYLKERLPDYMTPSAFVMMKEIPRAPNGKIDAKALPPPAFSGRRPDASNGSPRTPEEETLLAIWSGILGVGNIDVHDDFFDLGGHSLTATQVISRIREVFGIDVEVKTLFEERTIAALARAIKSSFDAALVEGTTRIALSKRGNKTLDQLLNDLDEYAVEPVPPSLDPAEES